MSMPYLQQGSKCCEVYGAEREAGRAAQHYKRDLLSLSSLPPGSAERPLGEI